MSGNPIGVSDSLMHAVTVSSGTAREVTIRACFAEPLMDVMNFLNEVVAQFPEAISFAPGRPLDSLCGVRDLWGGVDTFVADWARDRGSAEERGWRMLGQYSQTNGLVNDLIARHLAVDEGIHVAPDAIVVTVGAQEAMALVVAGLFEPGRDILLVSDPTYIGITGLARILGVRVIPVPTGPHGLEPSLVERTITAVSWEGRVRGLYDIPDFNNPLGTSLPLQARRELLDVCARHDVLMIEDNAYGMFAYDNDRPPTLKALDDTTGVLYIGSFSKTLFPGLRIGYLVADQHSASTNDTLAKALSRVKSLLTVNTPPLMQAVLAGALLEHGGSLEAIVRTKRDAYRQRRDTMVAALEEYFSDRRDITWARPTGGFFLPVTLPFDFGPAELQRCASDYGVIVCPMRFFCLGEGRSRQVRLSFSYVEPDDIRRGVARLAAFIRAYAGDH